MKIKMEEAIQVLERTPLSLEIFLGGLSDERIAASECESGWDVAEVIGYLIEAEKSDWIPGIQHLLNDRAEPPLPAHPLEKKGSVEERLLAFKQLRNQNINKLKAITETVKHSDSKKFDSEFQSLQLSELLSAWVVHDLTHLSQIIRVMTKQYEVESGSS